MADIDDIFSVRNNFWTGSFDAAIEEAQSVSVSTDRQRIDKEVFVLRSMIGNGDSAGVINRVDSSSPTSLLAVKMLATYLSQPTQRDAVVATIEEWLKDENTGNDPTLQLMAATIYFHAGDTKEALRAVKNPTNMEMHSLRVQIFIAMQRIDLAKSEILKMNQTDEDSTLSQMATAWTYLAAGEGQSQEAAYIFQEQIDRTMASATLMNSLAVCHMQMKSFGDAEKYLEEALAKEPSNPDIIVNLLSCLANSRAQTARSETLIATLRKVAPNHVLLSQLTGCMQSFNAAAAQLKV